MTQDQPGEIVITRIEDPNRAYYVYVLPVEARRYVAKELLALGPASAVEQEIVKALRSEIHRFIEEAIVRIIYSDGESSVRNVSQ